jgi:hypothetical protein
MFLYSGPVGTTVYFNGKSFKTTRRHTVSETRIDILPLGFSYATYDESLISEVLSATGKYPTYESSNQVNNNTVTVNCVVPSGAPVLAENEVLHRAVVDYVLRRVTQPSTWLGLTSVVMAFVASGYTLSPTLLSTVVAALGLIHVDA